MTSYSCRCDELHRRQCDVVSTSYACWELSNAIFFFLNDFEVNFALHITDKVNDSVFYDIRITINRSEDSDQFTGLI